MHLKSTCAETNPDNSILHRNGNHSLFLRADKKAALQTDDARMARVYQDDDKTMQAIPVKRSIRIWYNNAIRLGELVHINRITSFQILG
jgi:hypothetical protein